MSVYNWNPGPRRGKEGVIEKRIAGKLHIVTLQEAIEYVDHELLASRFHVTHYGGCAVLFNNDTFFPDVKAKSICLHDTWSELPDKIMEGDSAGFCMACHHVPLFADNHTNNVYAKERGIGKKLILAIRSVMLNENVDLVAGDFNGAVWRRDNSNKISIIEEAFADCALPMPPGPRHCGEPDRFLAIGLTCVVSLSRLNPIDSGRYGFLVLSLFLAMSWACARMIEAATTKHGSTSTLSGGMIYNSSVRNIVKGFS